VGIGQSRLHSGSAGPRRLAELVVVPGADHAGPQFDGHPLPEAALSFPAAALE